MNDPLGFSQSAEPNAPAVTIPDHELIVRIGGGSYGEVWLARNALGAFRAVKVIDRRNFEDDRPFEREFSGIQRFEPISRSHDGLVDILQVGRQKDYFYYVMELADGARTNAGSPSVASANNPESSIPNPESYVPRTLRNSLSEQGRLPVNVCVEIGLALTSALAHMHRHGLVHRDIKPSNIIFVQGAPKLADIGLVTEADTTLSYVGTEGYIPPEGPGATQADIFSLGKVLYEMATGQDRRQFPDLPPTLNEWPEQDAILELNEVFLKACDRDLRHRYQDCDELHADLLRLQRGQSVKRHHLWQRRKGFLRSLGLAATAVGLLVFAGLFVNKLRRGHVPDPEAVRLYGLGKWHYSQLTTEHHGRAYEYLTQAVRVDPKFVQPYGELMALYTWYLLPRETYSEEARYRETKEIADRAMAVDPNAAEGYTALSWCKFLKRDWRGAEASIQHAIRLNPNLPIAHNVYSFYLSMLGRAEEARREGQRAQELEPPGSVRVTAIISAWPFMAERRFDLAIAQLQRSLELDTNFTSAHSFLAHCYEAQSNYAAAIREFEIFASLLHHDSARVAASFDALRQAYATQGDQGYFRKWIELVRADRSLPEAQQIFFENNLAGYYARLGDTEKALAELREHFDEPQVWHQIKFDALYDSLHDNPDFKALVKRAGLEP
jgi:tetratricopeptide (TPR) repeat protein